MSEMSVFGMAAASNRWLAARQAVIAGNVANANTPGYRAKDVEPFAAILDAPGATLARTHGLHLAAGGTPDQAPAVIDAAATEIKHSGNSVTLVSELLKASGNRQQMALNVAVVKSYHRLALLAAKG